MKSANSTLAAGPDGHPRLHPKLHHLRGRYRHLFPNEPAIVRLIGAVLLEQNDEWQLRHRYMQLEAMADLTPPAADPESLQLPPQAA